MIGLIPSNIVYIFLSFAFVFYTLASWNAYRKHNAVLVDLGLGMFFFITAVGLMLFEARNTSEVSRDWLFYSHVVLTSLGLLGFISAFTWILIHGDRNAHQRLGKLALFVILPIWAIGTLLGIFNSFL